MNMKDSATRQAITHTRHCLTGCAIGEILGMAISTGLKWSNLANIILSVMLAFAFGYGLTLRSLAKKGIKGRESVSVAIATDTASITSMETIDTVFIILVPGAINAGLSTGLFWWSLILSLAVAFVLTVPVNRFMIVRSPDAHHHH